MAERRVRVCASPAGHRSQQYHLQEGLPAFSATQDEAQYSVKNAQNNLKGVGSLNGIVDRADTEAERYRESQRTIFTHTIVTHLISL